MHPVLPCTVGSDALVLPPPLCTDAASSDPRAVAHIGCCQAPAILLLLYYTRLSHVAIASPRVVLTAGDRGGCGCKPGAAPALPKPLASQRHPGGEPGLAPCISIPMYLRGQPGGSLFAGRWLGLATASRSGLCSSAVQQADSWRSVPQVQIKGGLTSAEGAATFWLAFASEYFKRQAHLRKKNKA